MRYPNVKFILLHCYPFYREAGTLARVHANVHLDASWNALLSPALLECALNEWVGLVPHTKIFLSNDSTTPEECYGSSLFFREVTARVLARKIEAGYFTRSAAVEAARAMFFDNAVRTFGNQIVQGKHA